MTELHDLNPDEHLDTATADSEATGSELSDSAESAVDTSDTGVSSANPLQSLLPRTAPRMDGFDLAGGTALDPAGTGTTLWTSFQLSGGRTALAAVLFKGSDIPGSLALAVARAFLVALGRDADSPAEALAATNDALTRSRPEGANQLIACAVVVPGESGAGWACAGPVHGGVIRRAGTFDELASHGPPLGMLPGFKYGVTSVELGPGDEMLVLAGASDGMYRGAADLVASLTGKPAGEVVSTVHKAIRKARADGAAVETSVLFLRRH